SLTEFGVSGFASMNPAIEFPIPHSESRWESQYEWRQHDEGGAGRRGLAGFGSHQEALRSHRGHGLPQHHRRAAPRREDGAARLRQLPAAQARAPQGPQSEDRRQGGRAAEESPVLQAGQGAQGADQQGAGARPVARGRDLRPAGRYGGLESWKLEV